MMNEDHSNGQDLAENFSHLVDFSHFSRLLHSQDFRLLFPFNSSKAKEKRLSLPPLCSPLKLQYSSVFYLVNKFYFVVHTWEKNSLESVQWMVCSVIQWCLENHLESLAKSETLPTTPDLSENLCIGICRFNHTLGDSDG